MQLCIGSVHVCVRSSLCVRVSVRFAFWSKLDTKKAHTKVCGKQRERASESETDRERESPHSSGQLFMGSGCVWFEFS